MAQRKSIEKFLFDKIKKNQSHFCFNVLGKQTQDSKRTQT